MKAARTAALFVRVSTEEQTTENQLPELRQLARARGLTILRTYTEHGSAAAKVRLVYREMMEAAHRGEFDVLIVWAIDRLGRSMVGNLKAILSLDERGVQVISARESWLEMGGPTRSLLVGVMSWVAEQERTRLSERTRAGMDRAKAQGKHVGRPLAISSVALVRQLAAGGMRQKRIARELGVSAASVCRALARARIAKGVASERAPK